MCVGTGRECLRTRDLRLCLLSSSRQTNRETCLKEEVLIWLGSIAWVGHVTGEGAYLLNREMCRERMEVGTELRTGANLRSLWSSTASSLSSLSQSAN